MKTKPNNSDWQERFKYFCNKEQTEILVHPKEVKDFISSELQREREKQRFIKLKSLEVVRKQERLKTLKEVEGIINPDESEETYYEEDIARETRNELIYELLSKIKELKKL